MHPAIRIVCFLVTTIFLARAGFVLLLFYLLAFLFLAGRNLPKILRSLRPFIFRLRWFWFSIIVLYGFLTPGETVVSVGSVALTGQGLLTGLERCAGLGLVLCFISLLNHYTSREQWQIGIFWLLKPLNILGFASEKIALRLSLTVQTVEKLQNKLRQGGAQKPSISNWKQVPDYVADLFAYTLEQARQQPVVTVTFQDDGVSLYQWIYPLLLGGLLWLVHYSLQFF